MTLKPVHLVDCVLSDDQNFHFVFNEDAAQKLLNEFNSNEPLPSITISGTYRSGKSKLLNLLCRYRQNEFQVADKTEGTTRGLWATVTQIKGRKMLVIDSEGLYDVLRPVELTKRLMCLTTLCSSVFMANLERTISRDFFDLLSFVNDFQENIKSKAGNDDEKETAEMQNYVPKLAVLVRNFDLQFSKKEMTDDEYLENCLISKASTKRQEMEKNFSKQQIKRVFLHRKCFCFPHPCSDVTDLEEIRQRNLEQLDPKFQHKLKQLEQYLAENAEPFKVKQTPLSLKEYLRLVRTYVDALNESKSIVLEDTWNTMSERVNEELMEQLSMEYMVRMKDAIEPHMPVSQEFIMKKHAEAYHAILDQWNEKSIESLADSNGKWTKIFSRTIAVMGDSGVEDGQLLQICQKNDNKSIEKSNQVLEEMWKPIMEKFQDERFFERKSAISQYQDLRKNIRKEFEKRTDLGPKAFEVLDDFLAKKKSEFDMVMRACKAASKAEKEQARLRQQSEEEERKNKKVEEHVTRLNAERKEAQEFMEKNIKSIKERIDKQQQEDKQMFEKTMKTMEETAQKEKGEFKDMWQGYCQQQREHNTEMMRMQKESDENMMRLLDKMREECKSSGGICLIQ